MASQGASYTHKTTREQNKSRMASSAMPGVASSSTSMMQAQLMKAYMALPDMGDVKIAIDNWLGHEASTRLCAFVNVVSG